MKIKDAIATIFPGGRALSVWALICGMIVSVEKIIKPIVALRAMKINAVRKEIPIILDTINMETRRAGRTISEIIISASSTYRLLSWPRIWLMEALAKPSSRAHLETWREARRTGRRIKTIAGFQASIPKDYVFS